MEMSMQRGIAACILLWGFFYRGKEIKILTGTWAGVVFSLSCAYEYIIKNALKNQNCTKILEQNFLGYIQTFYVCTSFQMDTKNVIIHVEQLGSSISYSTHVCRRFSSSFNTKIV
jgi:hypothetical protein